MLIKPETYLVFVHRNKEDALSAPNKLQT